MLFAFDFTSWYATLIYVVGGFLVLVAAAEKLYGWSGWVRDRNAPPEGDVGGDTDPYVVIGHPGGEQSMTPAHELAEDEKRSLTRVAPRYLIENKDVNGIRDVTTGVRARDGREHRFEDFFAGLIGPGEQAEVAVGGSIPQELISGVHESEAFTAFLYWARFRRDAVRWEVVYDPRTRRNTYAQLPAVQPQLNARVRQVGESGFVIDVTNTGNVAIDSVEVELPDGAENW